MNPELEKLYGALKEWGYITDKMTYDVFEQNMAEPSKQLSLYNQLRSDGRLSMSAEDFTSKLGVNVKKKEPGGQSSQSSQEASLAPSSSSTAPAPTAGIVSEPIDPTAGFPTPQEVVTEITPRAPVPDSGVTPVLDPLQAMAGGPTPDFGQVREQRPEMQAEPMQREQGYQAALRQDFFPKYDLSTLSDVNAAADQLRKEKGAQAYESRKKYDELSPYRAAKRELDNAVLVGEEANYQLRFADFALSERYGKDWMNRLDDPAIANDPELKRYADAAKALKLSEDTYAEKAKAQDIQDVEGKRRKIQKEREEEGVSPAQYYLESSARVGARFAAGVLTLPRNIGQALGLDTGQVNPADVLANMGEQLTEFVDTNIPKTSDLERRTFERVVDYGDSEVVVDENGKFIAAYSPDGYKKDLTQKEIDEFNKSGLGASAKTRFSNVAGTLDKVYEMAGDMFIARGFGAGTKLGTAATTYVQTHADAYNEAMGVLGADPNEAAVYATTTAAITGMLEAYVGDIETVVGKPARMAASFSPKDAKALWGKLGPAGTAMLKMEPVVKAVVGENAEEFLQKAGDMYARAEFNERSGAKIDNKFTKEEALETALLTTLLTAPLSTTQALTAVDDAKRRAVFTMAEKPELFLKLTQDMVEAGNMTVEEATAFNDRAQKIASYAKNLPNEITDEQRGSALAKEWNRMEAESRSKAENVLPAQAAEAKKVATQLQNEIIQDIQPQPVAEVVLTATDQSEQPIEKIEELPAKRNINERIIVEPQEDPVRLPAIEVAQSIPEEFRLSENVSTAVAEGVANNDPASPFVWDNPTIQDEVTNIALQMLRNRGYNPTPEETGTIRRFFVDSLSDPSINKRVAIDDAFDSLTSEYLDTVAKKDRSLRERFDPETVEDNIAAFFAGGGKVSPESFDRWGDPNLRKDGSVTSLYFKKGGRSIEDIADEWINDEKINTGTMDERGLIDAIVDFMRAYPKKNVNEYMAPRVEAQEEAKRKGRLKEQFGEREDFDESYEEAKAEIEAIEINETEEAAINDFIDRFVPEDEGGRVRSGALREAIAMGEKMFDDPDFDAEISKAWINLSPTAQAALRNLAGGENVRVKEAAAPKAEVKAEPEGKSFAEWSNDYRKEDGSLDTDKIKAEWNAGAEFTWLGEVSIETYDTIQKIVNDEDYNETTAISAGQQIQPAEASESEELDEGEEPYEAEERIQESFVEEANAAIAEAELAILTGENIEGATENVKEQLQKAPLPDKLTPRLVAEMMDQGILTVTEGNMVQAHLETGEAIIPGLLSRAEAGIAALKEVPDWMGTYQRTLLDHGAAIVAGTAQPGELFMAPQADGGLVVINAQGVEQTLKDAGAVKNGRAWFVPAEAKDVVLAELNDHNVKFSMSKDSSYQAMSGGGSMAGTVVRFFASKFGEAQMRRMRNAMAKAKTTDQRIAIAKRMTSTSEPVRASRIARFLSDKFGIPLVMDQAMIAEALRQMGRSDLVENGVPSPIVRGFFWNDQVYMNMDVADTETGVHEFGHVFLEAIRGTDLYIQFENAIRGSVYEQAVRENPLYEGMTDADILEEAMALAIGQRGAAITDPSAWMRFADTLDTLWARIKALFGIDVQNMKAREFADYVSTMMMAEADVEVELGSSKAPAFLFIGEGMTWQRKGLQLHLAKAREMEEAGADVDDIWRATGWFRGVDGMWRYELLDGEAGLKILMDEIEEGEQYKVSEILDYPELYDIDPSIGDINMMFNFEEEDSSYLMMGGGLRFILIGLGGLERNAFGLPNDNDVKKIVLHEVQHHIQETELFAQGGTPDKMEEVIEDAIAKNREVPVPGVGFNLLALKASGAYAAYRALAGEVEARLVEKRSDRIVRSDESPLYMMDIAPENQIIFTIEDNQDQAAAMTREAKKMDALKAPFITAKFFFGRNRVTDAAKVAAARGIIAAEIAGGVAPETSGVVPKLKKELGLSEKEIVKIIEEEREATGSRMYVPQGKRAFESEVGKKLKELWVRWFRPSKGLPKASWEALKKWHNEFRAVTFRFQQKMNRLEDAVEKLTNGSDRVTTAVFQQINNVLNGTQDVNTLHESIRDAVMDIRRELDGLSKLLIESGAIQSPEMAFTIFRGAGIEMTPANRDWMKLVVSILRKNPAERTADENLIVGKFFDTYGGNIGNYLYRSYRINEVKSWRERVPAEVKAKARNAIKKMITDKMAEEVQALQDKLEPLSDKVLELQQKIQDEINTARAAIRDAQKELQDVLAKQAAYQAGKGKPNKNFQKQEQRALKRLQMLNKILKDAEAAATMTSADFMLMANQPGFNTGGVNAVIRAIYARRKEIMKLEERVEAADAASYERLQFYEAQLLDVDAQIDVILAKNDEVGREGLLTSGRLGSKDMSVIQGRRKDIPEEIRDLMGEYTDARVNVMRSVYRIANTIGAANFLFATRDAGLREGWLSDKPRSKGAGGERLDTLIAPEGSAGMGPLAGLYTTAAIANAINSYNSAQAKWIGSRIYLYARGLVKRGLTVYSPASQGRNIWSNLFLATSMGWLNPISPSSWRAFVKARAAFQTTVSEQEADFMEDAIRRGAITRSVTQGDLKAAARYYDGLISEGYGDLPIFDADVETKVGKYFGKVTKTAERVYEGTDTMLKLWGYRVEIDKYAQALYGKKVDELTPEQQNEVKDRAAAVIAQTTPDYNMIPKVADILRMIPVASTFLAWQMEMYRTTINRITLGMAEARDSRTRFIGIQRIALGSAYAASIFAAEVASAIALGMDDEEREALVNKFKPWERNSAKVFVGKEEKKNRVTGEVDTEYTFYNLGQTDPYNFWKKPVLAMYNNSDSVGKAIDAGAEELYKQMLGTEILWAAAVQMYFDVNVQTKKGISMPGDVSAFHIENMEERIEFLRKRMQPGFAKVIFDIYDSATVGSIDEYGNVKTPGTIALNAIGLQVNKVRPNVGFDKWLLGKSFEKSDIENFIKSKANKAKKSISLAQEGEATDEQIKARIAREEPELMREYTLMNEAYNRHLQEVGKEVREHIEAFDVNPSIIYGKLKEKKYTPKEISVISGELKWLDLKL